MNHSKMIEEVSRMIPEYLCERYLETDDPSVVLNDYLSNLRNLSSQLEKTFTAAASNREAKMEQFLKLLHEIRKQTSRALADLQSDMTPEDANEDL